MKHEIKTYFATFGLFEIARTIPHAFVTMYLLSSGLSISQVTITQIFFMVAVTVFEIPSGIIADKFNKKGVFITACLLMSISYLLYIRIFGFWSVALAQFLYGTAVSLQSGSIDCLVLNKIYQYEKERIEDFTRWNNIIGTVSMLIGASIGTLLYTNFMKSNVYGIAAFGFICSAFLSLTLEPDIAQISKGKRISLQDLKDQLKLSVVVIHENHYMFSLIVIMGALQFILQPFFNYWQPISAGMGIPADGLFIIYFIIQVIGILAIALYKHVSFFSDFKKTLLICLFLQFIFASLGILIKNQIYLVVFLLSIVPRTFMDIKLKSELQKNIDNQTRSTITSINSAISRIFSMGVLIFISIISNLVDQLPLIFSICSLICCTSIFVIQFYYFKSNVKEKGRD